MRDALAEIWLQAEAADRNAISEAVTSIDNLLQYRPDEHGESREQERRILFARPILIVFRVLEAEPIVQVLFVQSTENRKRD